MLIPSRIHTVSHTYIVPHLYPLHYVHYSSHNPIHFASYTSAITRSYRYTRRYHSTYIYHDLILTIHHKVIPFYAHTSVHSHTLLYHSYNIIISSEPIFATDNNPFSLDITIPIYPIYIYIYII